MRRSLLAILLLSLGWCAGFTQDMTATATRYSLNNFGQVSNSTSSQDVQVILRAGTKTIEVNGFSGELAEFIGPKTVFAIQHARNVGRSNPGYVCDDGVVFTFNIPGRSVLIGKTDQPAAQYSLRLMEAEFK